MLSMTDKVVLLQREDTHSAVLQIQHAAGPALPGAGGHQFHQFLHKE